MQIGCIKKNCLKSHNGLNLGASYHTIVSVLASSARQLVGAFVALKWHSYIEFVFVKFIV